MRVVGNCLQSVVTNHLLRALVDHRVYQDLVAVVLSGGLTRGVGGVVGWRFVRPLVRRGGSMMTPLTSSVFTMLTSVTGESSSLMNVDWGGPPMVHCLYLGLKF